MVDGGACEGNRRRRRCQSKASVVPLFYFHVKDGREWPDEEGTDLPSSEDARAEALRHAGDMLKENVRGGPVAKEWRMRVKDQEDS